MSFSYDKSHIKLLTAVNSNLFLAWIFAFIYINVCRCVCISFLGGSVVKNPPANAGDAGLIPGWGRCPGEGNGNPLQLSCLGNAMDRGAWWATVHGVAKSWK